MPTDTRADFLGHLRTRVNYWANHATTPREAAEGMTFSFLVLLDGESMLPAFTVRPLVDGIEGPDIIGRRMLHDEWCEQKATNAD